jgi:hypothetical protein
VSVKLSSVAFFEEDNEGNISLPQSGSKTAPAAPTEKRTKLTRRRRPKSEGSTTASNVSAEDVERLASLLERRKVSG